MPKHQDKTTANNSAVDMKPRPLEYLLDIKLDVSAEIGRTQLLLGELIQLSQGSIIELDKLAGAPVEIYIGGNLIAYGDSVVVNERYGVRLAQIISPEDRIKHLG